MMRKQAGKPSKLPILGIKDIRVLCHPPVQNHPNIVRLLGIAWCNEEDLSIKAAMYEGDRLPKRAWPIAVIEKAPEGSLATLLKSRQYQANPPSLMTKLKICIDVLNGIVLLHKNNILHADIKAENVLIFRSDRGTGQNWTAKICDFSRSQLDIRSTDPRLPVKDFIGTLQYSPPELSKPQDLVTGDPIKLEFIDVWCWGMLLWYVLMDGMPYFIQIPPEAESLEERLKRLQSKKISGDLKNIAIEECRQFLQEQYHDYGIVPVILESLSETLECDPDKRPNAEDLLKKICKRPELATYRTVVSEQLEADTSLSLFNITKLYYDLLPFPRVAKQIVGDLEALSGNEQDPSTKLNEDASEAMVQLGLCHIIGFGVERSYRKARDLLAQAARGGNLKSQAILPTISTALGVCCDQVDKDQYSVWLKNAASKGSRTAFNMLVALNDPQVPEPSTSSKPSSNSKCSKLPLLQAAEQGATSRVMSLLQKNADPVCIGSYGETPLHYAVLLPSKVAFDIVNALLDHGVNPSDPGKRTYQRIPLSEYDFLCNEMPEGTTPMDWAIIEDNQPLACLMLSKCPTSTGLRRCIQIACQYLSIDCLRFFLDQIKEDNQRKDILSTFENGLSLLYYAARPDIFTRLLRIVKLDTETTQSENTLLHRRQIEVIKVLLEARSSTQMTENNAFNIVHLLTSFGEPELLEFVLQNHAFREYIDQPTLIEFGRTTALKDAILRQRKDNLGMLVRHCSSVCRPDTGLHAIHICARVRDEVGREFAEGFIAKEPVCVYFVTSETFGPEPLQQNKIDKRPFEVTPLQLAAYYGNVELIKLLISKKANLLESAGHPLNSLGIAVASRSIPAVRQLRYEHRQRELPLHGRYARITSYWSWFCRRPSDDHFSAVSLLLADGQWSFPGARLSFEQRVILTDGDGKGYGAADFPFSPASQQILRILVKDFQYVVPTGAGIVDSLLAQPFEDFNLKSAIMKGNLDALEIVMGNTDPKRLACDFRGMRHLAVCMMLNYHCGPVSEKRKEEVEKHLSEQEKESYEHVKKARESSWMGMFWKLYYLLYGCIEEEQYREVMDLQKKSRHVWWGSSRYEFGMGPRRLYSRPILFLAFGWCFLAPLLSLYKALLRVENESHKIFSPENERWLVASTVMVQILGFFPFVCRILTTGLNEVLRTISEIRYFNTVFQYRVSYHLLIYVMAIILGILSILGFAKTITAIAKFNHYCGCTGHFLYPNEPYDSPNQTWVYTCRHDLPQCLEQDSNRTFSLILSGFMIMWNVIIIVWQGVVPAFWTFLSVSLHWQHLLSRQSSDPSLEPLTLVNHRRKRDNHDGVEHSIARDEFWADIVIVAGIIMLGLFIGGPIMMMAI